MATRLTDRGIAALKPSRVSVLHFDSEVSGLALKVYPSGRKSFVFDFRENGKQRRITIGQHPTWSVGKARRHAGTLRLKVDTGTTVAPRRGTRLADLVTEWREVVRLTRRRNTIRNYNRLLACHVVPAFGQRDPRSLTRNDIEHWHGAIASRVPVDANRALSMLGAFLSWCEHAGKVERNVAKGIKRRPENHRQVFLGAQEIIAAHAALDAHPNRAPALALKLALLTGARIGEVLAIEYGQLDVERRLWIKPASSVKQKRAHILPLQEEALTVARELLRLGPPLHGACRRVWERVRVSIGRPDTRVHDLRHSRASALARGGASLLMIGKVLGHTNAATTSRYAHLIDEDLRKLIERS